VPYPPSSVIRIVSVLVAALKWILVLIAVVAYVVVVPVVELALELAGLVRHALARLR
jgi:hypothetical protein